MRMTDEQLDSDVSIVDPAEREVYELCGGGDAGGSATLRVSKGEHATLLKAVTEAAHALDDGHPFLVLSK